MFCFPFYETWARHPMFWDPQKGEKAQVKLLLGLSGGLDSTVLAYLLNGFRHKRAFELVFLHVHYGLRGRESDEDAAFVEGLGKAYEIPVTIQPTETHQVATRNIQQWARSLRLAAFQRWIDRGYAVALAHHQDDLAETVLLRLARGSSCASLLGMQEWKPPFWRPFLQEEAAIHKSDLAAYAVRHNLPYREDSSNATMKYSRNRVRHTVLPELERMHTGAGRRLVACAKEAKELFAFCETLIAGPLFHDQVAAGVLPVAEVVALPKVLGFQKLALFIKGKRMHQMSRELLECVWKKLLCEDRDWSLQLSPEWILLRSGQDLCIRHRLHTYAT